MRITKLQIHFYTRVNSLDHLFGAILPAAIRKKGLSLGAAEMKAVAFDNLFLYE